MYVYRKIYYKIKSFIAVVSIWHEDVQPGTLGHFLKWSVLMVSYLTCVCWLSQGNGHPPLHSMSPFVPSSVENSAPASAHDKNGAKHGGSNGAPLNYEGEVLGTITRVDSPKNSQAAKEDDQPCSALVNFRMKKRYDSLWYFFTAVKRGYWNVGCISTTMICGHISECCNCTMMCSSHCHHW